MTNKNPKVAISSEELYMWMSQMNITDNARQSLILLAEESDKGLSSEECAQLADQILLAVGRYELLHEQMESDAGGAMRQFLDSLNDLDVKERIDIMDQLFFGLRCAEDERLFQLISAENGGDALYRKMRGAPDYSPGKEEELRSKLIQKAGSMRVCPGLYKKLGEQVKKNGNCAASAAAFGREGYMLKCVTAMELYLNGESAMSPDEAVALACTSVDLEAVGDAVNRGLKVQRAATIALSVIVVVGSILLTVVAVNALGAGAGAGAGAAVAYTGSSVVQYLSPTTKELTLFSEFMKPHWAQSSAITSAAQTTAKAATEETAVSNAGGGIRGFLISICISALASVVQSFVIPKTAQLAGKLAVRHASQLTTDTESVASGFEKMGTEAELPLEEEPLHAWEEIRNNVEFDDFQAQYSY